MTKPRATRSRQRTLLVLVAVLTGVIACLVAGIVAAAVGTPTEAVLIAGAGAFVVTVKLVLHILKELRQL
ncbi:hypothetical protein G3I59_32685 [Amycolatopsis rubida]|uniref:Uncharacterized protein n=1 Tax=Amycolatopsis rubida TaxID=112413 RepID=A0A1I5WDF3_9PSEU|nr:MULTISPECIES: hypothetical protein [Amycolatopsis]MYW95229.1 hypothetical protein [Amycolatopsis rubida]NEC60217.1 hypothetical protein [Amycolatopsis rubida]OAP28374.1 hypothetical protein A4R44_00161 [Amycolatopsis sp. M39]SFQ17667.1 hypothetical protein SAMN05421854_109171 [Amycolatopsis rubida]